MLATSMGLEPAHFKPHIKPLRLVSAEIKESCCLVADEISKVRRSRLTEFMATFPEIVAALEMRLIDLDFEELTSMCAAPLINLAAAGLRALASEPVERREIRVRQVTDLAARYVLCTSLEAVCDHHAAELQAIDRHKLVVQLSNFPPCTRTGYGGTGYSGWSFACVSNTDARRRVPLDGSIIENDEHRGACHVPLESIVRWWAGRGRTIDRSAALLFLSYFECEWGFFIGSGGRPRGSSYSDAVMNLANGAGSEVVEMALSTRTALLDLHAFLKQHVDVAPEQLQRELRRRFGAHWTITVRDNLALITMRDNLALDGSMCGNSLYRRLAQRVMMQMRLLFQAMVSEVMSNSLPPEAKAIICRKWLVMLPSQSDFWGQLHLQVQRVVANVP